MTMMVEVMKKVMVKVVAMMMKSITIYSVSYICVSDMGAPFPM